MNYTARDGQEDCNYAYEDTPLVKAEIRTALAGLPGWTLDGNALV